MGCNATLLPGSVSARVPPAWLLCTLVAHVQHAWQHVHSMYLVPGSSATLHSQCVACMVSVAIDMHLGGMLSKGQADPRLSVSTVYAQW